MGNCSKIFDFIKEKIIDKDLEKMKRLRTMIYFREVRRLIESVFDLLPIKA